MRNIKTQIENAIDIPKMAGLPIFSCSIRTVISSDLFSITFKWIPRSPQENISISDASSVLSDLSYDYIDNSEINEEDNTDDDSIPKLKIFDNDVNNNIELEIEEL